MAIQTPNCLFVVVATLVRGSNSDFRVTSALLKKTEGRVLELSATPYIRLIWDTPYNRTGFVGDPDGACLGIWLKIVMMAAIEIYTQAADHRWLS